MTADSPLLDESPLLRSDRCLTEKQCVTTLTLNRPTKFNALSEELLTALQIELDEIANSDSTQVVVIAASGKAYCAGHDLKQMRKTPEETYYQALFAQCGKMMQSLTEIPQPVIAKVQGMATAAGCQLVAACDLAIAAENVQFAVSGVNLGLFCSTPSVALSRNISRKRAFEMLVTGDFIDTAKAKDWGLINDAVPAENLDERVDELVDQILKKPSVAIRTGKTMFYKQLGGELPSAYQYAGDVMAGNMMAADTIEGIDAFIGKRPPKWRKD